jgi:hypothetical protein
MAADSAGINTSASVLLGDTRGGGKGPRQMFLQGGRASLTGAVRVVVVADA